MKMTIKDTKFLDITTDSLLYTMKDAQKAIKSGHAIKAIGKINEDDSILTSRIVTIDRKTSLIITQSGSIYNVVL